MGIAGRQFTLKYQAIYIGLTLCLLGSFACCSLSVDFFFKINFFFFQEYIYIPSEFQTVWIQIRPDIL